MTLQINKELRRIALLLVIAGMIMGLASPSACDEFYNNLLKLNGQPFEISSVNASPVSDCINATETTGYSPYRPVVSRSGNSRPDLFRLAGGSLCASDTILINLLFWQLLIPVICAAALSNCHILFIHLKDGHK